MALAMPVSSSRLRNTKPLAVPGRWRAITHPAMRTECHREDWQARWPSGCLASSFRGDDKPGDEGPVIPVPRKSAISLSSAVMGSRGDSRRMRCQMLRRPCRHWAMHRCSSGSSSKGPARREARSTCHKASRRWMAGLRSPPASPAIKFNAPISASAANSVFCKRGHSQLQILDGNKRTNRTLHGPSPQPCRRASP